MKRLYKIGIISLVVMSISFLLYYFHVKYMDGLVRESNFLIEDYGRFCGNYYDCLPRTRADVEIMMDWIESTSGYNIDERYHFLRKDGYGVKYDSISKQSLIYSYGKDGKDDLATNTLFNDKNTNPYGQYQINSGGLFNYYSSFFRQNDIILAKLIKPLIDCDFYSNSKDYTHLDRRFEVFNKSTGLSNTENTEKLKLLLKQFSRDYFKDDWEKSTKNFKTIFLTYNKGKIEFVCDVGLSDKIKTDIIIQLESLFSDFKNNSFDYSMFYIFVPSP